MVLQTIVHWSLKIFLVLFILVFIGEETFMSPVGWIDVQSDHRQLAGHLLFLG